jgi:hypothetical protein
MYVTCLASSTLPNRKHCNVCRCLSLWEGYEPESLFFLSIIIFRKKNWADCLSFDNHIIFACLKNLLARTSFGWNRTTLMDNVFENLHMLLTTLVTNATSIVTVTMLVRTSAPTVNMITHLTEVRIGVGTQTERTRTYYYDPQKFLTYFFIFLASLSFFSKPR